MLVSASALLLAIVLRFFLWRFLLLLLLILLVQWLLIVAILRSAFILELRQVVWIFLLAIAFLIFIWVFASVLWRVWRLFVIVVQPSQTLVPVSVLERIVDRLRDDDIRSHQVDDDEELGDDGGRVLVGQVIQDD